MTPWRPGMMTVRGSITATAVLFVLLLASATVGWMSTTPTTTEPATARCRSRSRRSPWSASSSASSPSSPCTSSRTCAKILGPVYAIAEGFFVGAISKVFEEQWNGIVVQAAGATIAVFAVMLVLYRTRIIKVTDRFRRIVIFATLGVMALYLVSFVISLFGGEHRRSSTTPRRSASASASSSACIAAINLALDFDFIERGAKAGLSKDYEWVAAVGLLVTIVWLYLEILRLLAKLRQN